MNISLEQPTVKNGIKSWISCMELKMFHKNNHLCEYHYHDYIEILYGLDCDAAAWIDGNTYSFKTGDLVLINSNEPHRVTHNKDSHYICIKVLPTILYADEDAIFELKYVIPFIEKSNHQRIFSPNDLKEAAIRENISEIVTEYYREGTAYELIIRANLLRIFAWIFRFWERNDNMPVMTYSEPVKKALTYISENYDTVTADSVAKHCGFSYNYFSCMFKKEIGKNFKDYIISLRLREAEKKLISTDDSITDIALSCGFSTSSYFVSRFKVYKNMTPKKFRDMIKTI